MKIKRQKKVNKILSFFKQNFGFRPPFLVLLDGTFPAGCLAAKVNIKDQLPKYLGEVKILTTSCCVTELETLGAQMYGATRVAKQFPIFKCGHSQPIPASECVLSLLSSNNPQHFLLASQDQHLRVKARRIAGTPILYLHGMTPTLEKPSGFSEKSAEKAEDSRLNVSQYHGQVLKELKKQVFGEKEVGKKRKKKGPKGANPLSCKKKKNKSDVNLHGVKDTMESGGKKRKRNRNKNKKVVLTNESC